VWEIVNKEIKDALADRLEGWEIVDFLQISAEDVIEAFEDKIIENLDDVLELANLRGFNNVNDNN
jgi:predicted house-cleaning noncanonical NTP pyrophosphatase (MazG superfamily)